MADKILVKNAGIDPAQPELDKLARELFTDAREWGEVCAAQKHLLPLLQERDRMRRQLKAAEKYIEASEARRDRTLPHTYEIVMDAMEREDAAHKAWVAAKGET